MTSPPKGAPNLLERFPALRRLRLGGSARRLPFVQQNTAADCGAACLAMVLAFHGKDVSLEQVRQVAGSDRDGTDALSIKRAAEYYGLQTRAIKLGLEGLKYLSPGTILHWEFRHFVVFERVGRKGVQIVDPALGRRRIPMDQFGRSFTGVALSFEPSARFEPGGSKRQPFKRYLQYVLEQRGLLARLIIASVFIQLFALALPVLTGTLVDRVVPRGDYSLLLALGLGMAVLVVFHFITALLRAMLLLHLQIRLDLKMTLGFVDHLMSLPYAFFGLRPAGDLLMRMNSNTNVREIITSGALSALLDGTLVSLYFVLLFAASPAMALLVVALGLAQIALFVFTRTKQRELMARGLETQARTASYQLEMLTGIETLKSVGAERLAVDQWSNLYVDTLNASLARGRLNAVFDSLSGALKMGAPLAVLGFGGYLVLQGQLSLGTMLAVSALAMGFFAPLATLLTTAVQLQLLRSYLERIGEVLDAEPEQHGKETVQPRREWKQIVVDDVSFGYGPLAPLTIKKVSLQVPAGQMIAIVGPSGSGKSTLARLLLGLYEPTSGSISYDDVDLKRIDFGALRRQLGIVTQDPQLFSGSIRENICLTDPSLPLNRVIEAARLAAIDADIQAMPMGYETILADRGLSLSGGQRQRIALARALVGQPAVLLLDEATSAVDGITEKLIHRALDEMRCTRIVIAHRLSTVISADCIFVLQDGELVERGNYVELVAQGGLFAKLAEGQIRPASE